MNDRREDLAWGVERSIRYHDKRAAFFNSFALTSNLISLLGGSAALAALGRHVPIEFAPIGAMAASAVSFLSILVRPAAMSAQHTQLKQRFCDLDKKVRRTSAAVDDATLAELEAERIDIEKTEPEPHRALDLICHNELALAKGICDDDDLYRLSWWMSLTANLYRWDVTGVRRKGGKQ